ncbi:hypothetical protein FOXYSP1_20059 [Fusarium oxysporum f. sp. phaseoli]
MGRRDFGYVGRGNAASLPLYTKQLVAIHKNGTPLRSQGQQPPPPPQQ